MTQVILLLIVGGILRWLWEFWVAFIRANRNLKWALRNDREIWEEVLNEPADDT